MKRCAIYCRTSTQGQKDRHTIESQKYELPRYAEAQGWQISGIFIDEGISGGAIQNRPDFVRLLADGDQGNFDTLLVAEFSRIMRIEDLSERGKVLGWLQRNRLLLASPSEGERDISSFLGEVMIGLESSISAEEKRKISQRMRKGRLVKHRNGQYTMPTLLYGLRKRVERDENGNVTEHRIELDPEQSKVLHRVWQWIVKENYSLIDVAARLNREKVKSKRGGLWTSATLSNLFAKGDSLTGTLITNRRNQKLRNGRWIVEEPNPETEWVKIPIPKIFNEKEYAALKKALHRKKIMDKGKNKGKPDEFLLRGLVKCGICGSLYSCRWSGKKGQTRTRYYACAGKLKPKKIYKERCTRSPWVNAKVIEELVLSKLIARLLRNPRATMKALDQAGNVKTVIAEKKRKLQALEKDFDRMDVREERLLEFSINNTDWTPEVISKKTEQLKEQRKALERERSDVLESLRDSENKQQNIEQLATAEQDLKTFGKSLVKKIQEMNLQEKREVIKLFLGGTCFIQVDEGFEGRKKKVSSTRVGQAGTVKRGPIALGWSLVGSLNLDSIINGLKRFQETGKLETFPVPTNFGLDHGCASGL